MRWVKLAIPITLLVALLIGAHLVGRPSCGGHLRHDKTLSINGHTVYIQTAKTLDDQHRGLSGLSCIGSNEGMLFEFDQSAAHHFWMKGMQFPLDMIWLGSNEKVVTELQGISPSTYPQTFVSDSPAQYVLELPAGQANKFGILDGQKINF